MGIFNKAKKQPAVTTAAQKESKPTTEVSAKDLTLDELQAKTGTQKTGSSKKATKALRDFSLAYKWLARPLITEKATYLGTNNQYLFNVSLTANKIEIRKAVEELYGVKVKKVNIIRSAGKAVSYGRVSGRTKRTKKAIVTLQSGQSIELYEGV